MNYQPTIKVEVLFSMSIDGTDNLVEVHRMSLFEYLTKFNTDSGIYDVREELVKKEGEPTAYTLRNSEQVAKEVFKPDRTLKGDRDNGIKT